MLLAMVQHLQITGHSGEHLNLKKTKKQCLLDMPEPAKPVVARPAFTAVIHLQKNTSL